MAEPAHAQPSPNEPPPQPPKGKGRHHDEPKTHAADVERLTHELQQANDKYLRTLADFDNTKKRLHREKEEFVRYAAETMVRELLPIIDSLDQALVAVDKQADPQAIIKGIHLIYRQLLGLLAKEGVERIATVGEPFDPHKHEAVAQIETTDGTADETIVEQVQVGYTMHGRTIRPAMVKIAKNTKDQTSDSRHQQSEAGSEQSERTPGSEV